MEWGKFQVHVKVEQINTYTYSQTLIAEPVSRFPVILRTNLTNAAVIYRACGLFVRTIPIRTIHIFSVRELWAVCYTSQCNM